MDQAPIVVLVTAPDQEVARRIARALVENQLAACVNILSPINSIYRWQGKIYDETEVLLVVKTRLALLEEQLVPAVKALHPYEVPEIIALPIQAGSQPYLDWIAAETGG